ncbi:MAG: Hsp20 family protein [Chitinivibrionales bacterium]|nr:Hsp20 family protein [Chitinivibrionales bacterium]MBD3355730.1 Hsp20 family protein [Chitinivibrionales bacterium]
MKSLIPWRHARRNAAPASLDDWFGRMWNGSLTDFVPDMFADFPFRAPSIDIEEDKKAVTVRAEVPGMNQKDLDLSWHDGVLRIRGEKKEEREERKKNRRYCECGYGRFSRDVAIDHGVDWERAKAKYHNGVLTVTLPKAENERSPIEIEVK